MSGTVDVVEPDDVEALGSTEVEPDEASERLIADRLDALDDEAEAPALGRDEFSTGGSVEPSIADRLDAAEAEKVLQRALELEADAASAETEAGLTPEQLERVAEEVGVAPEFVQEAIGQVKLAPRPRGRFARWVLPEDLFETATIDGTDRDALETLIQRWMTQNEGLARGRPLDDGSEWELDRRWRSKLLSWSLSGANRISKVAGGDVAHRVQSVATQRHVVALSSEGFRPLMLARLVMAVGVLLAAAGIGAAITNGVFAALPAVLVPLLGSVWLGVAGARWWARGIRGALRRSLNSIQDAAERGGRRWLPRWPKRKRNKKR